MGRLLIIVLVAASFFAVALSSIRSRAQDGAAGITVADLQEQLEDGLKARLPAEFDFIARVVDLVKQRQFSTGEVKSIFQWARRKNPKTPFPYFERAMRILAGRKKIDL